MRIFYDGRVFQFQKAGGIGRYFAEVISGLPEDWEPIVMGVEDFGRSIPTHPRLSQVSLPDFRPRRFRKRYQDQWWKPRLMRSVQLTHPTYYDLTSGLEYTDFKGPLVITVYDFLHARYPEMMEGSLGAHGTIAFQRQAIERANHIICISESTQRDLAELYPNAAGKTSVCHLASSFPVVGAISLADIPEFPSFLFVGGRGGYKNFLFLLRAFGRAFQSNPRIRLLIAGSPLTFEEKWQISFCGLTAAVEEWIYPDEITLQALYKRSIALLYPSRHEGFGLPPLEAMANGTLAIASNTTSLPEVMGDAGIMLSPTKEVDWADCINEVSKGGGARRRLVELGLERAKQFSWKRVVDHHLRVYADLT